MGIFRRSPPQAGGTNTNTNTGGEQSSLSTSINYKSAKSSIEYQVDSARLLQGKVLHGAKSLQHATLANPSGTSQYITAYDVNDRGVSRRRNGQTEDEDSAKLQVPATFDEPTKTSTSSPSPFSSPSPWAGYIDQSQLVSNKDDKSTRKKNASNKKGAGRLVVTKQQEVAPAASSFSSSSSTTLTSRSRANEPQRLELGNGIMTRPMTSTNKSNISNTSAKFIINKRVIPATVAPTTTRTRTTTADLDIARFSINGMMNLVEERMRAAEMKERSQGARLGANGHSKLHATAYEHRQEQAKQPKRAMHIMREEQEQEEILNSSSSSSQRQANSQDELMTGKAVVSEPSRTGTFSKSSSEATIIRDEVKELLSLARKASNEMTVAVVGNNNGVEASSSARPSFSSSGSGQGSTSSASLDLPRAAHSSAGVHASDDSTPGSTMNPKNVKSQHEMMKQPLQAVIHTQQQLSQLSTQSSKKKFALFGGSSSSKKVLNPVPNPVPASFPITNATPIMHHLPPRSTSAEHVRSITSAGNALNGSGKDSNTAQQTLVPMPVANQRISKPHYGALTMPQSGSTFQRHGRKRSMSVPDPVPFSLIQAAGRSMHPHQQQHEPSHLHQTGGGGGAMLPGLRRPRPDVYDESYFSSLKAPYYASLATEGQHKQRQNALARLGIVEEATESNRAIKARSRIIAMGRSPAPLPVLVSRNISGHPGALKSGNAELTRPSPTDSDTALSTRGRDHQGQNERDGRNHRVQDSQGSISSGEGQYATYELAAHVKIDGTSSAPGGFMDDEATSADAVPGVDLARSRSQRRRGQLMMASALRATQSNNEEEKGNAGTASGGTNQNHPRWNNTVKTGTNVPVLMRSNSDASFIDPYIPEKHAGKRTLQVAVPSPVPSIVSTVDSLSAIGPPPSTPLPTLPGTISNSGGSSLKNQLASTSHSFAPSTIRSDAVLHSGRAPAPADILVPSVAAKSRSGLSPAPSPAPTSPLPPPPPPAPTRVPPPPPPSSTSAYSSKDENGLPLNMNMSHTMQLRPHRTQQQGRSHLSPVDERFPTSPSVSPVRSGHTSPVIANGPFGSKGIPQALPSELDMTVLPSPTPLASSTATAAQTQQLHSSSTASNALYSSTSLRRTRSVGRKQNRPDTLMTVASQYSIDGDFDESDGNASRSSIGSASCAPGMTYSSSGNTTSTSISTNTSISKSSRSIFNAPKFFNRNRRRSSSGGWHDPDPARPSLSMDGHTEEDDEAVEDMMDEGDNLSQASHNSGSNASSEISNNLAGLGTYAAAFGGNLPHSKKIHFGWQRTAKASRDLATTATRDHHRSDGVHGRIAEEDEMYEGILGSYADITLEEEKKTLQQQQQQHGHRHYHDRQYQGEDEGYIGSSPELISPTQSKHSKDGKHNSQRQRSQYTVPVRHTRSFDQLSTFR